MDENTLANASLNTQALLAPLRQVRSLRALERHPHFRANRTAIEYILSTPQIYSPRTAPQPADHSFIRCVAWNIERGIALDGITTLLRTDRELADHDVLLLTEVDHGMARSGNRNIAEDLAYALDRYVVFGPAFLNLDKGNGAETKADGENGEALQGHAIVSRYPIEQVELVPLPNPKDHTAGKERRIGHEQALIATISTPNGVLHCASVHLSAHSSRRHRVKQMKRVLQAMDRRSGPALIGGDWNTTTYNAHRAYRAILGFWRRVAMGVRHVMAHHYPYPERYFERPLFRTIRRHAFTLEEFNISGGCTAHYDFSQDDIRHSLGDWVPQWCFRYIEWALRPHEGRISFKLDWFAGRNLRAERANIVSGLPRNTDRLSDHDPIVVDVRLA